MVSTKVEHGNLEELLFLREFDELMGLPDAVVPADLLCCNVVVAKFGLSGAQVHVICGR